MSKSWWERNQKYMGVALFFFFMGALVTYSLIHSKRENSENERLGWITKRTKTTWDETHNAVVSKVVCRNFTVSICKNVSLVDWKTDMEKCPQVQSPNSTLTPEDCRYLIQTIGQATNNLISAMCFRNITLCGEMLCHQPTSWTGYWATHITKEACKARGGTWDWSYGPS